MKRTTLIILLYTFHTVLFAQNSLLDTSSWSVGNGPVAGFTDLSGTDAENVRQTTTGPHGSQAILWTAIPDIVNGGNTGGFKTDYTTIDHTKTYRYSVWMKKEGSHEGKTYIGPRVRDINGSFASLQLDGSGKSNPYFWSGDLNELDQWYLLVGYVHGSTYTGTTSLGAVYDTSGQLIRTMTDFKLATNAHELRVRMFLTSNPTPGDKQYFYDPTIYEVNGQEPSILELLDGTNNSGSGSDIQAPTSPILSTTGQSQTTVDLSWNGSTDDTAVTGYKIFKDGILEATLGNVTTYQATGLTVATAYQFKATALDAAGNESPDSNIVSVTTSSGSGNNGGGSVWSEQNSVASYADNVAIGTATVPSTYKLAVNGKIIAEEVRVELSNNGVWPDYVFDKDYKLPTLQEVEQHIQEKGHLINIPSASEVKTNGIELGEMNKLLLEKIEELTLYILEQERRLQKLEDSKNEKKNR